MHTLYRQGGMERRMAPHIVCPEAACPHPGCGQNMQAAVLAQLRVDAKTNEHKAALELLGVLRFKGKVITGDAMFTHRDVCSAVIEGGGDYVPPVKDNQPTLARDVAAVFAEPLAGLSSPPNHSR